MALTHTPPAQFGDLCPDFNLKGTDNKTYSLSDFTNGHALLVLFICNHCPYVQAIEDRLVQLGHDLRAHQVNMVAISPNDAKAYPADSFENMQKRVSEKAYSFVYLHDATQEVAKKFGAVCTPDYFVYDKDLHLAYRGRLDDSWKEPQNVTKRELFAAVLELEKGHAAPNPQTPSMGCSIKWL